ncbi:MAG TPA: hypothetical protein VJZ71_20095 [Phycisphaerae bacterium]|nr:hypothetical protein [Phycisphaerae bacterium]
MKDYYLAEVKTEPVPWKDVFQISAGVLCFGAITAFIALWVGVSPSQVWASAIFGAVMVVLTILNLWFRWIGRAGIAFMSVYFHLTLWMGVAVIPAAFFRWLSATILDKFTVIFQVVAFVLWGILFIGMIALIATQRNRERLFGFLRSRLSFFAPFAYSFNALWISIFFFSAITYYLVSHGNLALTTSTSPEVNHGRLMDFYLWHFLEAIPVLKLNSTLLWKEPLVYETASVGWMLLAFKVAVIVPVIGAFAGYRAQSRQDAGK